MLLHASARASAAAPLASRCHARGASSSFELVELLRRRRSATSHQRRVTSSPRRLPPSARAFWASGEEVRLLSSLCAKRDDALDSRAYHQRELAALSTENVQREQREMELELRFLKAEMERGNREEGVVGRMKALEEKLGAALCAEKEQRRKFLDPLLAKDIAELESYQASIRVMERAIPLASLQTAIFRFFSDYRARNPLVVGLLAGAAYLLMVQLARWVAAL